MRVCADIPHTANVSLACTLTAVGGVWDEAQHGYTFTDHRVHRKRVEFGRFFATKPELHLSKLYVVEPYAMHHAATCEVAQLADEQIVEFDRVAALDAERPDFQYEWWEPAKQPEEDESQHSDGGMADEHARRHDGRPRRGGR